MNGSQRLRFLTIIPPINNLDYNDVCQIQSVQPDPSDLYSAKFNGSIGKDFFAHDYSRSVIIKSHGDDLSGGEFTIKGFQNGAFVTNTFIGPVANEIVDSDIVLDTITSLQVTDNLIGSEFSATGGKIAYSRPLFLNWSNPNTNLMSYGLSVRNPGAREYAAVATQVFTQGVPLKTQVANPEKYGLTILVNDASTSYLYKGVNAGSLNTSVAYPLFDAFFVAVNFDIGDASEPTVIVFPQIGR